MSKTTRRPNFVVSALFLLFPAISLGQLPVIPDAAGYGINTVAGRGGNIIRVTNLNDSGPGSFRACTAASGPRICIFEVSGAIRLQDNIEITNGNLTIAGQTAPFPGITLRDRSLAIRASDILVQHIAIRAGDVSGPDFHARDSLRIVGNPSLVENIVIDHVSLSWAIDEVIEVWNNWDNVTISNSIIAEPLREIIINGVLETEGYGVLVDTTRGDISFVGNLFANTFNRNPRTGAEGFVFVNNVVYNVGNREINLFNGQGISSSNSIVGNIFIKGPASSNTLPVYITGSTLGDEAFSTASRVYVFDNVASQLTSDPWSAVLNNSDTADASLRVNNPPVWPAGLSALRTANDVVLNYVLGNVGAHPAARDSVDERVIAEVVSGTGQIINCVAADGTPRCAKNAGGWPNLAVNFRSLELPGNPNGDDDGDGYTNVEEWLHTMAIEVEGGLFRPQPPALTVQ
jgi:hypothetical protein